MLRDKAFLNPFIKIVIPISLQFLFVSSLGIVDTMMVGQLGSTAIAAVSLANQVFYLLNFTLFGVHTGAAIFTAQYWGNGDIPGIRRVLGVCLMIGFAACALFSILALVIPAQSVGFYTQDPEVIALGSEYLRIVGLSYLATMITVCFTSVLRSVGRIRVPVFISIATICLNTLLNYLLIFGHLGLPRLGVVGAATATSIARVVECLAILLYVYLSRSPAAASIKELTRIDRRFWGVYLGVAAPVVANEVLWAIGTSLYNAVYAHIGTDQVAAVSVAITILNLASVIFNGISTACGIMVGNAIGAGQPEKAFLVAKRSLILGGGLALVVGFFLFILRFALIDLYQLQGLTRQYAYDVLGVLSFAVIFRAFNPTIIVGTLRSGGDVRFSALLDVGAVWLVGVPLAFLGGYVLNLPIHWVVVCALGEGLSKSVIGLRRVASKKWMRNLTQAY
jgi:putative MATE family efflux protein